MSGNIIKYHYKSTLKLKYWENYLGRKLKKHEYFIIKEAEGEHRMNVKIMNINDVAKQNGLYIPQLSGLVGNCIFECLRYHKLCDNIEHFRCGLAYLLILFKDTKYFIPNQELTLEEIFNFTNNIETVFCKKNKRLYKYSFIAMCLDLAKNCSWTRLNTELVFLAMSVLFNIRIIILHNNGHKTEIKTIENDDTTNVYLGLIDEIHYIPIAVRTGNQNENSCPKYLDSIRVFHNWAQEMAVTFGRVEYEIVNSNVADSNVVDSNIVDFGIKQITTDIQPEKQQKNVSSFGNFRNIQKHSSSETIGMFSKIPMSENEENFVNF